MSMCFRRTVINRIARSLQRTNEDNVQDIEKLERQLLNLMKVNPVSKSSRQSVAQYRIPKTPESKELFVNDNLCQFKDDVIKNINFNRKSGFDIKVDNNLFTRDVLTSIQKLGCHYGYDVSQVSKKHVVVEYSSPNIAKPFHVGHLHSTIIGNFIANLYEAYGHKVTRINYLGDWGTQLSLLILGYKRYGNDDQLERDPLEHLFQVYVKIHQEIETERANSQTSGEHGDQTYKEGLQLFKLLETGDKEITSLWKKFREISLVEYAKMYKRLGMTFDEVHCESMYKELTPQLLNSLEQRKLLHYRDDGVGYIDIDDRGQSVQAVMNKSDGSTLYLSRDVTAALDRYDKYQFDSIHYVVGEGQQFHFRMLLQVLNKIQPAPWNTVDLSEFQVMFGRIDGMSSRKGTVVFLRDILDEAKGHVLQSLKATETTKIRSDLEGVADKLGISSIIIQYLRSKRIKSYTFSWDKMLNFKSDSGLFLQYCHARLYNLEIQSDIEMMNDVTVDCLTEDSAYILVQHLARYPDVVNEAMLTLEPYLIVQYLFNLGHFSNLAYKNLSVKNEPTDIAKARLLLFKSARQTLANGMRVLGVEPLNQM